MFYRHHWFSQVISTCAHWKYRVRFQQWTHFACEGYRFDSTEYSRNLTAWKYDFDLDSCPKDFQECASSFPLLIRFLLLVIHELSNMPFGISSMLGSVMGSSLNCRCCCCCRRFVLNRARFLFHFHSHYRSHWILLELLFPMWWFKYLGRVLSLLFQVNLLLMLAKFLAFILAFSWGKLMLMKRGWHLLLLLLLLLSLVQRWLHQEMSVMVEDESVIDSTIHLDRYCYYCLQVDFRFLVYEWAIHFLRFASFMVSYCYSCCYFERIMLFSLSGYCWVSWN